MEKLDIFTIRKRSVGGVFALVSRAFFLNILSYGASLVIFTYLSPKDVGVFIAVSAIQRVISFVTDFGLGAALVQKKDAITQKDISTVFTAHLLIATLVFLAVFVFRENIGAFFNLGPSAVMLLLVLVFTLFLSSFKVIPSVLLEREIRFHNLILPQMLESFVFNIILIALALNNYGIDSYSWAFLVSSIISIPFYYFVAPWKLKIGIYSESLSHLKYGVKFQAKNILATLKDDFLTVFLSKTLSFAELSYIGFGQRNAFFIYRYIVDSITKVTFSTFSRIQDDKEEMRKTIQKSLFYVSLITFPVLTGLIIIAPYVIFYFPKWQNKWEPALFSLVFFCLNAMVSSLSGILVNVLDATGRVKTTLKLMMMWTVLTWTLTPLLISVYGYNGVALASFLVTFTLGITIFLVKKIARFSLIKAIYKPLVATVSMGIFTWFLSGYLIYNLISILLVIVISGLLYGGAMWTLARKEFLADFKSLR